MKQGELFTAPGLELDSCIAAALDANERFCRQEQAIANKAKSAEIDPGPYVATDDDLPGIFFQPTE